MFGQTTAPIYGASHAVLAVLIRVRAHPVYITANRLSRSDELAKYIRTMDKEVFRFLWESHVVQMGGSQYDYETAEARQIFLIAINTLHDQWQVDEQKEQYVSPAN